MLPMSPVRTICSLAETEGFDKPKFMDVFAHLRPWFPFSPPGRSCRGVMSSIDPRHYPTRAYGQARDRRAFKPSARRSCPFARHPGSCDLEQPQSLLEPPDIITVQSTTRSVRASRLGSARLSKSASPTRSGGSFWQNYKFMNPATKKVEPKEMYCEMLNHTAVCGGVYSF